MSQVQVEPPARLTSLLSQICPEVSPGLQVFAASPHARLEMAAGVATNEPMRAWSCFPTWCAAKPVLFQAALAIAEERGVGPGDPIGVLLPPELRGYVGDTTVADLGAHRGGFDGVSLAAVLCEAPERRRSLFLAGLARGTPGCRAYGEYLPWGIAEAIVETHSAAPCGAVLDDLVESAGIYELHFGRFPMNDIGWWWGRSTRGWIPMVGHAVPSKLAELSPAVSGVGSARGLGEWYVRFGRHMAGVASPVPGLFPSTEYFGSLLSDRNERHDRTLRRVCGFSAGFAYPLGGHGFACIPDALGLAGWLGRVFGLIDLESQTVISVLMSGAEFDRPERIEGVRDALVDELVRSVGVNSTS